MNLNNQTPISLKKSYFSYLAKHATSNPHQLKHSPVYYFKKTRFSLGERIQSNKKDFQRRCRTSHRIENPLQKSEQAQRNIAEESYSPSLNQDQRKSIRKSILSLYITDNILKQKRKSDIHSLYEEFQISKSSQQENQYSQQRSSQRISMPQNPRISQSEIMNKQKSLNKNLYTPPNEIKDMSAIEKLQPAFKIIRIQDLFQEDSLNDKTASSQHLNIGDNQSYASQLIEQVPQLQFGQALQADHEQNLIASTKDGDFKNQFRERDQNSESDYQWQNESSKQKYEKVQIKSKFLAFNRDNLVIQGELSEKQDDQFIEISNSKDQQKQNKFNRTLVNKDSFKRVEQFLKKQKVGNQKKQQSSILTSISYQKIWATEESICNKKHKEYDIQLKIKAKLEECLEKNAMVFPSKRFNNKEEHKKNQQLIIGKVSLDKDKDLKSMTMAEKLNKIIESRKQKIKNQ